MNQWVYDWCSCLHLSMYCFRGTTKAVISSKDAAPSSSFFLQPLPVNRPLASWISSWAAIVYLQYELNICHNLSLYKDCSTVLIYTFVNVNNRLILFDLILYIPVKRISVMSGRVFLGWTSTKQGLICLAQEHNAVTLMRREPATSQSRVKHSTNEPLRSQIIGWS